MSERDLAQLLLHAGLEQHVKVHGPGKAMSILDIYVEEYRRLLNAKYALGKD